MISSAAAVIVAIVYVSFRQNITLVGARQVSYLERAVESGFTHGASEHFNKSTSPTCKLCHHDFTGCAKARLGQMSGDARHFVTNISARLRSSIALLVFGAFNMRL